MQFVVYKGKKILRGLLIAVIFSAFIAFSVFSGFYKPASAVFLNSEVVVRKIPIYNVDRQDNKVALTFDAAWGADKTQGIIDILNQHNIKATFFLVGFWVEDYPEQAKAIKDNGMEIGTHSNTHPDMAKLDAAAQALELSDSIKIIENYLEITPKLFRAPFGSYNNTLMDTASKAGLTTIQWNVDSLDWKGISAADILKRVSSKTISGSIILFHNNSDNILDALPAVIDCLKNKGYDFCTVGELIYSGNAYVDMNGVQHSGDKA